ncbi:uncharacterized protein BX663DRAFT_440058, partial [Cokeromyces recurvatus]|uniref:uncharacterized protein n=1 Tax=Cokeromyces recurvatus TaxID=90255 RepID=UPI00222082F8
LNRNYSIYCLHIHYRSQMPQTIDDPFFFLPSQQTSFQRKPSSTIMSASPWFGPLALDLIHIT